MALAVVEIEKINFSMTPVAPEVSIRLEDAPEVLAKIVDNLSFLFVLPPDSRGEWWKDQVYRTLEVYTAARMGIDIRPELGLERPESSKNMELWKEKRSTDIPIYENDGEIRKSIQGVSVDEKLQGLSLITMCVAETSSLREARKLYKSYINLENYAYQLQNPFDSSDDLIMRWVIGEENSTMTYEKYKEKVLCAKKNFEINFSNNGNEILKNAIQRINGTFGLLDQYSRVLKSSR